MVAGRTSDAFSDAYATDRRGSLNQVGRISRRQSPTGMASSSCSTQFNDPGPWSVVRGHPALLERLPARDQPVHLSCRDGMATSALLLSLTSRR